MNQLLKTSFAITLTFWATACSSSSDNGGTGGSSAGGTSSGGARTGGASSGGASSGGSSAGGTSSGASSGGASGGTSASGGGSAQSGGTHSGGTSIGGQKASGGADTSGGKASGGKANGGSSSGGAATGGGTQLTGGRSSGGAGGGTAGTGGGGRASTGGASTGGSASGGSSGGGATCPLPSTFKWSSGGPAATPASGWDSIKDFTYAPINGKHMIYMSMHSGSAYGAAMMSFTDWPGAASATQTKLSFAAVAPTIFYFTPKQTWVLTYQWGATGFSYRTSTDPLNASGWSGEKSLYGSKTVPAGSSSTGVIDQTVICDAAKCYLFFAGDNGYIYRSSMAIGSFPGEFPAATTVMQDTAQKLFEAVQVYTVKGSNKYMMIVEAQGNGRYFRAWTATDLGGTWTLLTDTFAAKSNTTFSQNWTNDISHGDLVRSGGDETIPIDPCDLKMIFQGRDPNSSAEYDKLPYRLGLLTAVK